MSERPGWDDRFHGNPHDEEPELDEGYIIDLAYELNEALKEIEE